MRGQLKTGLVTAGASALVLLAGSAGAFAADLAAPKVLPPAATVPAESTPIDFIFGGRLQSDYRFRGISQSNRDPSGQTYFELQLMDNFFYGGFATYKVDLPTRPAMEMDLTAGIRPKIGPFAFDLGLIYYYYPGERQLIDLATGGPLSVRDSDFAEAAFKVAYTYNEAFTVGAGVFHAPNFLNTGSPGTFVNGTAKYTLPENLFGFLPSGFAISAEVGHYFLGRTGATLGNVRLPDYTTGNIGVSYTYDIFTIDVRYHDTTLNKRDCFVLTGDPRGFFRGSGTSNWCSDTVVATLSVDLVGSKTPGIFAPAAVEAPAPSERGGPPRARDATGQAFR